MAAQISFSDLLNAWIDGKLTDDQFEAAKAAEEVDNNEALADALRGTAFDGQADDEDYASYPNLDEIAEAGIAVPRTAGTKIDQINAAYAGMSQDDFRRIADHMGYIYLGPNLRTVLGSTGTVKPAELRRRLAGARNTEVRFPGRLSIEGDTAFVVGDIDTAAGMKAAYQLLSRLAEFYGDENSGGVGPEKPIFLDVIRVIPEVEILDNAAADAEIGPLAAAIDGDCVLRALEARYPKVHTKRALLRAWRRPLLPSEIISLLEVVSSGRVCNRSIGIRLKDRHRGTWWEHNTTDAKGAKRDKRHVVNVEVANGHARLARAEDIEAVPAPTKMVIVPEADLIDIVVGGAAVEMSTWGDRIGTVVCEDTPDEILVSQEKIDGINAEYAGQFAKTKDTAGFTSPDEMSALSQTLGHCRSASAHGIALSLWKKRQPGLQPLPADGVFDQIAREASLEALQFEAPGLVGKRLEALDVNSHYASYDHTPPGCPVRFEEFGIPAAMGVVAPVEDEAAVLKRQGFARVSEIRYFHRTLAKHMPSYLQAGRWYNIPWLAWLHRSGHGEFSLDIWAPCTMLSVGIRGPNAVLRQIIGKLRQRETFLPSVFTTSKAECDRLVGSHLEAVRGDRRTSSLSVKPTILGDINGFMLSRRIERTKNYGHVRAGFLAYAAIKMAMVLVTVEPEDVLRLKVDSIALKPEVHQRVVRELGDQLNVGPGCWKLEYSVGRGEFTPDINRTPLIQVSVPSMISTAATLVPIGSKIATSKTAAPWGISQGGHRACLADAQGEIEIGGSDIAFIPLRITVDGIGGGGKSVLAAGLVANAERVAVCALAHRQVAGSADKIDELPEPENGRRVERVSLEKVLWISRHRKMYAANQAKLARGEAVAKPDAGKYHMWKNSPPDVLRLEETSTVCRYKHLEVLRIAKAVGIATIVESGDAAQLDPVCICPDDDDCDCMTAVKLPRADVEFSCLVDLRSKDEETRDLKAGLRELRVSGIEEDRQEAYLRERVTKTATPDEAAKGIVREAFGGGKWGIVVCGTHGQMDTINEAARDEIEAAYGDRLEKLTDEFPSRCIKLHVVAGETIGQGTIRMMSPSGWGRNWTLAVGVSGHSVQGESIEDAAVWIWPPRREFPGWNYVAGSRHVRADQIGMI